MNGELEKRFTQSPTKGSSSGWTTDKEIAWRFAREAGGWNKIRATGNDVLYLMIFVAKIEDNKDRFLAAKDGTYKLIIPNQYNNEDEATGLGPIKVSRVEWKLFSSATKPLWMATTKEPQKQKHEYDYFPDWT